MSGLFLTAAPRSTGLHGGAPILSLAAEGMGPSTRAAADRPAASDKELEGIAACPKLTAPCGRGRR